MVGLAVFALLMFLSVGAFFTLGALGVTALLLSERMCGATLTASSVVQPPITVLHVASAWLEKMANAAKIILNLNLNLQVI